MKIRTLLLTMLFAWVGFMLTSCAPIQSSTPPAACTATDLNNKGYTQKVDNFLVLLDASSTMSDALTADTARVGHNKLAYAKQLLLCMNDTIPNISVNGALRVFGPLKGDAGLVLPMGPYAKDSFKNAVLGVTKTGGVTPMGNAIAMAAADLENTTGQTAVIIISDGLNNGKLDPVAATEALKAQYGSRVCIYTVAVGDGGGVDAALMQKIAAAGQCGSATTYQALASADGMANFVIDVFLNTDGDDDGDGVPNSRDKCPNTPKGAPVDKDGCPLDSDGDGVYDYLDQCPNTPKGVVVDYKGCPIAKEKVSVDLYIEFDFDKATIKPQYHNDIKTVADFMNKYPSTVANLEGHTCNIGTDAYNQKLSERRVNAVRSYLMEKFGIAPSRITATGYGESRPIASNDTEEGRKKNRRVTSNIFTETAK